VTSDGAAAIGREAGCRRAELLEDRAVGGGACGLAEHPTAAGALERVDLQVRLLVGGGDAGVAERVVHAHGGRTTMRPGVVVRR
jgi:hypothetical protein